MILTGIITGKYYYDRLSLDSVSRCGAWFLLCDVVAWQWLGFRGTRGANKSFYSNIAEVTLEINI